MCDSFKTNNNENYKKIDKSFYPNSLNSYVINKNFKIIENNYKLLSDTMNLFLQMEKAVEVHKINLINLLDIVKTRDEIDQGILNILDNSVNLLLTNLQRYIDTPKCHITGLGSKIIPEVPNCYEDDISEKKDFPFSISCNTLQYQMSSVLYGSLTNGNQLISGVGLGSIPLNPSIYVSVSYENKEIFIRYKFINDGVQDLCFPLLWSCNININPSCIIYTDDSEERITVQEFIERVLREIKNLSALSGIFSAEYYRFHENELRFKKLVYDLVPLPTYNL